MIDPYHSLYIILSLIVVLLITPLFNCIPYIGKYVSRRYLVIVVIMAIVFGCILDFDHLTDDTRKLVIGLGIGCAALFLLVASVEKWLYNGWLGKGKIEASLEKGDVKGKISYSPLQGSKEVKEDNPDTDKENSHSDDLKGLAEREQL